MYIQFLCVCVGISVVLLLVTELVNKLKVQNSRYVYIHTYMHVYVCMKGTMYTYVYAYMHGYIQYHA